MLRSSRYRLLATGLAYLLAQSLWCSLAFAAQCEDQCALLVVDEGAAVIADHQLEAVDFFETEGDDLLVVKILPGQSLQMFRQSLLQDPNVRAVDEITLASVGPPESLDLTNRLQDLEGASDREGVASTPCLDAYVGGSSAWASWAEQSAVELTRVREAQDAVGHCGEGVTVAIIDTGVDAEHPLLADATLVGYDFLADSPSSSPEWNGLTEPQRSQAQQAMQAGSTASSFAILEESARNIVQDYQLNLGASSFAILEAGPISVILAQTEAETVEGLDLPPLFGHGTMVAGLVRLVAPGASILPLRAFDAYGVGESTDIVRAIYYAVDHDADVINLSFSMNRQSSAIKEALRYAREHGVVVVAAAGNRSSNALTFPASDNRVIGVAASENDDALADFSNYGPNNADLVAPGVALISAYPGGYYAAGWGTSFSTPLVAGAAALLRFGMPDDATTQSDTVESLLAGVEFVGLQGTVLTGGRLDTEGAVLQSLE